MIGENFSNWAICLQMKSPMSAIATGNKPGLSIGHQTLMGGHSKKASPAWWLQAGFQIDNGRQSGIEIRPRAGAATPYCRQ